jgi:hypothetical protein
MYSDRISLMFRRNILLRAPLAQLKVRYIHTFRVFSAQADWTLTHTSPKDTEQSTIEASITLDGLTLTDPLIRWSLNKWPSVCREIPVLTIRCSGRLISLQNEHPIYRHTYISSVSEGIAQSIMPFYIRKIFRIQFKHSYKRIYMQYICQLRPCRAWYMYSTQRVYSTVNIPRAPKLLNLWLHASS